MSSVSSVDIPITRELVGIKPSIAADHQIDVEHCLWSKVVNLDLCDRASLSSLIANIGFMQELSPFRIQCNTTMKLADFPDAYLSLPINISVDQNSITISYEFSSLGTAFDMIQRKGSGFSEAAVAAIISRALKCVEKLHSNDIFHRNLCAKHLLLVPRSQSTDDIRVALCGLGSLAHFPPSRFLVSRNDIPPINFAWRGWKVPSQNDSISQQYSHPAAWYAPEVITQDFSGYSSPSDIYSLGLVMAELYSGIPPYCDMPPTLIALKKLMQMELPELMDQNGEQPSAAMQAVYSACTQYDAKKRPHAHTLLENPWIQWGLGLPFTEELLLKGEKKD